MQISMESVDYQKALLDYFTGFKFDRRNTLLDKVLHDRTRYISVALENIYQPHNASAVLRSCDCFGVQDVHIIENSYEYQVNPQIALGAAQWLTLKRYNELENNTSNCIAQLRESGYRIVSTTPQADAISIYDFDIKKGPFVLFFGTEREGLSSEVLENSDEFVHIPMYGFTESFNISVSVSLCLFHFSERIRNEAINWKLNELELLEVKLQWMRNTIRNSELLERKFKEEYFLNK